MEKCSCCDRKFERLEDFPLISVHKFERLDISGIVESNNSQFYFGRGSIPGEVLRSLDDSDKKVVSHEGLVYRESFYDLILLAKGYRVSRDLTEVVKEAVNIGKVQRYLRFVEDLTEKSIRTDYLNEIRKSVRLEVGDYNDISLSFNEDKNIKNDMRKFRIELIGGAGSVWGYDINCGLADVSYQGKIYT